MGTKENVPAPKDTGTYSNRRDRPPTGGLFDCILGRIYGAPAVFGTLKHYIIPKISCQEFFRGMMTFCGNYPSLAALTLMPGPMVEATTQLFT